MISKLYNIDMIEMCYDSDNEHKYKEKNGWKILGYRDRVINIENKELNIFANLLEGNGEWESARIPDIYEKQLIDVLKIFTDYPNKLVNKQNNIFTTEFWHETNDQNSGYIMAVKDGDGYKATFPETIDSLIYSAPNIGSLNPYSTCTRRNYRVNSDYDRVDLTVIPDNYLIRCKYRPGVSMDKYYEGIPNSPWGKVTNFYRLVSREFVGCDSERTLTWLASLDARQVFLMISL